MIIVDNREVKGGIPKKLEEKEVEVVYKQLKTGDYHIIGKRNIFLSRMTEEQFNKLIDKVYNSGINDDDNPEKLSKIVFYNVEKKGNDLIISILTELLQDQLYRSSSEFYRSILLIEGGLVEKCINYGYRKKYGFPIESAWAAIVGAIIRIAYDGGAPVSVIMTADKTDTARFLRILDKKIQEDDNFTRYPPVSTKLKVSSAKKKNDPEEIQKISDRRSVAVLCNFYGLAKKKAVKLLEHFGSVKAVFNASSNEISEIKGFSLTWAIQFIEDLEIEFVNLNGDI